MTPCTHRGLFVFDVRSQLCGCRGTREPVYRCGLHVICTHRKYRHNQTEQVCLACDDYTTEETDGQTDDRRKTG
jgi:hypothetical protein